MLISTKQTFALSGIFLLSTTMFAISADAQLIAADSFDGANYSPSGLNSQNPNISPGWTSGNAWASGSANLQGDATSLQNPATTYDDASDGKGQFVGVGSGFPAFRRAFHALDSYTPADTYFMSFFVDPGGSFTQAGSREHALVGFTNFFIEDAFENFSADRAFGIQVGFRGEDAGAAPDTVDLIVRARDVGSNDLIDTVLVADAGNEPSGETYHVLLKLDINVDGGTADDITYWVNPANIADEASASGSSLATGSFQSDSMDQNDRIDRLNVLTNNWTNRGFFWDETRLGYDFSSVAGAPAVTENADFDADGDVDGLDYLIWQEGFGSGTTQGEGDANNSGAVDGDDLAVWQAQYGAAAALGSVTSIPEPGSLLLVLLGTGYFVGTSRIRF